MADFTRPTYPDDLPRWATGPGESVAEPIEAKKDTGHVTGDASSDEMNWLQRQAYRWLGWTGERILEAHDVSLHEWSVRFSQAIENLAGRGRDAAVDSGLVGSAGVFGTGGSGDGAAADGPGVRGESDNGPGVSGESADKEGVLGEGCPGVKGVDGTPGGVGVEGIATDAGTGVKGTTNTNKGVEGIATGSGVGVSGTAVSGTGGVFSDSEDGAALRLVPRTGDAGVVSDGCFWVTDAGAIRFHFGGTDYTIDVTPDEP